MKIGRIEINEYELPNVRGVFSEIGEDQAARAEYYKDIFLAMDQSDNPSERVAVAMISELYEMWADAKDCIRKIEDVLSKH